MLIQVPFREDLCILLIFFKEILDICKKYGPSDRNLWVEALSYFASKEDDCKTYLMEVLNHIDQKNLLPPLMVVEALSRNATTTLAVIKVSLRHTR